MIERTLASVGEPLSPMEIWDKAKELGTIGDFTTPGKTPWSTIGAYCYTDIKDNGDQSRIVQTNKRPPMFALRNLIAGSGSVKGLKGQLEVDQEKNKSARLLQSQQELHSPKGGKEVSKAIHATDEDGATKAERGVYHERDLHPLLATFAYSNAHFRARLKTIYHESSRRGSKGQNEWLHPDLVGVYFPFSDYASELLDLQRHLSVSAIRMFSFEMKVRLDYRNLRECFFQAVSNSSWANEGYLVAAEIEEDDEFQNELRRLSNAFGIGIIRLDVRNVHESDILFPARSSTEIDWDTVNRLATENRDFKEFLTFIKEDTEIKKVKSSYDKVLDDSGLRKWMFDKGLV